MGGVAVRWRFRVLAWYEPRFGAGCGSLYYGVCVGLLFNRSFNCLIVLFILFRRRRPTTSGERQLRTSKVWSAVLAMHSIVHGMEYRQWRSLVRMVMGFKSFPLQQSERLYAHMYCMNHQPPTFAASLAFAVPIYPGTSKPITYSPFNSYISIYSRSSPVLFPVISLISSHLHSPLSTLNTYFPPSTHYFLTTFLLFSDYFHTDF